MHTTYVSHYAYELLYSRATSVVILYERVVLTLLTLVVIASTYYWLVLVAGGSCGRNFGNRESRGREVFEGEGGVASEEEGVRVVARWAADAAGRYRASVFRVEGVSGVSAPGTEKCES